MREVFKREPPLKGAWPGLGAQAVQKRKLSVDCDSVAMGD